MCSSDLLEVRTGGVPCEGQLGDVLDLDGALEVRAGLVGLGQGEVGDLDARIDVGARRGAQTRQDEGE